LQPASSPQHFLHVSGSLQQLPLHAAAAGLQLASLSLQQEVAQPVVIKTLAAQMVASRIIVFMVLFE
jgi:hypothetical protein